MTMNHSSLSPLLFLVTLLAVVCIGFPMGCMASNLRASSTSSSEDAITVSDSDLVGTSSFVVVQLNGYGLDDLVKISPKKHAILDCAFRQAFDEVHGDRDGLYLSGQQIVATDAEMNDTDEEVSDTDTGVDDTLKGVELRHVPYVYRPRKFSRKMRPRPPYPPPKPPPRQYPIERPWNLYWFYDNSGRCNMCPDDDSMETTSLLLNSNMDENESEQLALDSKKARDEGIASDFLNSEASLNTFADVMRAKLIEGTCVTEGDNDSSFEYVQDTDIFALSKSEFEASVAAIHASRDAMNADHSIFSTVSEMESSHPTTKLLPFYFGEIAPNNKGAVVTAAANRLKMIKIGLSGVGCGPWDNEALLDFNSGLHDSVNSLGLMDKGHVLDKIVGRSKRFHSKRRYVWKCHYDLYAKMYLGGDDLDEPSLENISDALCDDMVRNGGKQKFRNVIDCQLQVLSAAEYESIVSANEEEDEAGFVISSARE